MYPNEKVQILLLNTHLIDPKHTNWKHMGGGTSYSKHIGFALLPFQTPNILHVGFLSIRPMALKNNLSHFLDITIGSLIWHLKKIQNLWINNIIIWINVVEQSLF
jgi:hypothetical protein